MHLPSVHRACVGVFLGLCIIGPSPAVALPITRTFYESPAEIAHVERTQMQPIRALDNRDFVKVLLEGTQSSPIRDERIQIRPVIEMLRTVPPRVPERTTVPEPAAFTSTGVGALAAVVLRAVRGDRRLTRSD